MRHTSSLSTILLGLSFLCLCAWSSIPIITAAINNDDCSGPRTPDEIARLLWGNDNNNQTKTSNLKRTRPNVSRLLSQNPNANPSLADPETVKLGVTIYAVKSLDQKKNEFEIMMLFKQRWNDYRLDYALYGDCYTANSSEQYHMDEFQHIWKPDTSIANLVDEPILLSASFWIMPNGDVEYFQRLSLKLSCKFNFMRLPHDTQSCQIITKTISDNKSKVLYQFYDPPLDDENPDSIAGSAEWVIIIDPINVTQQDNSAVFNIDFKRDPDSRFVIIPVVLIVILGWASFFIDRSAVPARITMSIICFLTISNFLASQLKNLPRIGANSVWLLQFMLISMIFTFYAVVEYIICNYFFRVERRVDEVRQKAKDKKRAHIKKVMMKAQSCRVMFEDDKTMSNTSSINGGSPPDVNKDDMLEVGLFKIDRLIVKKDGQMIMKDQHIEIFSRYAYPIIYAIVCLVIQVVYIRE